MMNYIQRLVRRLGQVDEPTQVAQYTSSGGRGERTETVEVYKPLTDEALSHAVEDGSRNWIGEPVEGTPGDPGEDVHTVEDESEVGGIPFFRPAIQDAVNLTVEDSSQEISEAQMHDDVVKTGLGIQPDEARETLPAVDVPGVQGTNDHALTEDGVVVPQEKTILTPRVVEGPGYRLVSYSSDVEGGAEEDTRSEIEPRIPRQSEDSNIEYWSEDERPQREFESLKPVIPDQDRIFVSPPDSARVVIGELKVEVIHEADDGDLWDEGVEEAGYETPGSEEPPARSKLDFGLGQL
jgi:hypothetical protein